VREDDDEERCPTWATSYDKGMLRRVDVVIIESWSSIKGMVRRVDVVIESDRRSW
jgi:hypothetical protein